MLQSALPGLGARAGSADFSLFVWAAVFHRRTVWWVVDSQGHNDEHRHLLKEQHKEPDKARRYLDLLDTARCNGRWEEVPELARKVEKHVPRRNCLALTARCEYQITSTLSKRPSTSSTSSATASLAHQIPSLLSAVENEKSFPEDAFEAQVCLGWLHWSIGELNLALSRIPPDVVRVSERLSKDGRVLSGWTHVCIVKGAYIRGISQEHAGSIRAALETYKSVLPGIELTRPIYGSSHEHRMWTERLLHRYCILSGRHLRSSSRNLADLLSPTSLITPSAILPPFRAWAKLQASEPDYGVKSLPSNEPTPSRRRIWQVYYEMLSILLEYRPLYESNTRRRQASGSNPTDFDTRFLFDSKLAQSAELKRVEMAYESHLINEVGFPKANEANVEVEKWVDLVMSNWLLMCGPNWQDENLERGGKSAISRRVLEILYRAATRTFHSTRILRHLFTVHTALAEFELAGKALHTYFEIVSRGKARVEKSGEAEIGLDDDSTVFWTAAAGIHMLCVHGRRTEAERSQEIVRLTEEWLKRHRTVHEQRPVESAEDVPEDLVDQPREANPSATGESIAAVYRALGVSRIRWSRLTYAPTERPELQEQAVASLRMASGPNLNDTHNVKTSYYSALALAEKRETDAAIESVRSALSASEVDSESSSEDDSADEQNGPPTKLSPEKRRLLFKSWHLLALLLTAKQNFDAAIESCEAALELYGGNFVLFGSKEPSTLLNNFGMFERRDIAELKMTQIALVEVIDGPEEAVNASGELLSLYAKLFQYSEPQVPQISPVSTVSPSESANSAPRSLRASIFGHSHKAGSNHRRSRLDMGTTGSDSTFSQISPHDIRTTPSIQVTSDVTRDTATEPRHHHQVFRHGSKKLHKRESGKSMGSVRKDRTSSPARLSTAKSNRQPNLNLPPRSRPSTANSSNQRSRDSDPYASDEVGVAVSHNGPSKNHGPPAGLDGGSSAVAPLPPTSQNTKQHPAPSFPKPSGEQDTDFSHPIPKPPPPVPEPIFDSVDTKRHSLTLLIKIWLLMAGLYRRASMPTDAAASLAEAESHTRTIETLVVQQNGSSNETLTTPGWGGLKAVAELWADVLAEKAMLHLSKDETVDATQAYEKALLWWPDHLPSTVGLCNWLLDSYAAIHPPQSEVDASLSYPSASLIPKPKPNIAPPLKKIDSTESLSRLAARDRAYGLLIALTKSGQGWDCSEAWMALARAYELGGEIDRAKEALWWVVELEEGRGVREWSVVGGW